MNEELNQKRDGRRWSSAESRDSKAEAANMAAPESGASRIPSNQESNQWQAEHGPSKQFDLEDRTLRFGKGVRQFIKKLERTIANTEDAKQLVRSSGSVGANYVEASEGLSRKDFFFRIKIARKEARESRFWLRLLEGSPENANEQQQLAQEAQELMSIFGAIAKKADSSP